MIIPNARIGLDLDGTLQDSFPTIVEELNQVREEYGLKPMTRDFLRSISQARDWNKLYRDMGFPEELLDVAKARFIEIHSRNGIIPPNTPRADYAVEKSIKIAGLENVGVITNDPLENAKKRLAAGSMAVLTDRVVHAFEGKTKALVNFAGNKRTLYVGDSVSDGEDVLEARELGADVVFAGLGHDAAFSPAEKMRAFVETTPHGIYLATLEDFPKAVDYFLR